MKRFYVLMVLLLPCSLTAQQNSITLKECQNRAGTYYPVLRQTSLLKESAEIGLTNLNRIFLPVISLNGTASLQSAVTEIPFQIPGMDIPGMNKDQYRVYADVSQLLFDGGITGEKKKMEVTQLNTELRQNEVEKAALNERVQAVFFGILLLRAQEKITASYLSDITEKHKAIRAAVDAGASLRMTADLLYAEIIRIRQQQQGIRSDIFMMYENLSLLTGSVIDSSVKTEMPVAEVISASMENKRPEPGLYDLYAQKFDGIKALNNKSNLPRLSLFCQAGAGRPALNMLSNDFEPYWILGARFSWNFGNLWITSGENKRADIKKDIVFLKKESWYLNQKLQSSKEMNTIRKLEDMIRSDEDLLAVRQSILSGADAQLENGAISPLDYISFRQAKVQAEADLELHRIQLVQAKMKYLTTYGIY